MTPLDFILSRLESYRAGWKDPQDQAIANMVCDLLQEVARARARPYPDPYEGDGFNSWRDQIRMLESDLLQWLIPYMIMRFADPRCTNQSEIAERLTARLELYRSLAAEVAAA